MEEKMKSILREKREALGISQVRLGSLSGLANNVISDFERGARRPWPRARKALARALRVPEAELFPEVGVEAGEGGVQNGH